MMAVCEDAPCCGCCGSAVWAADAQSEMERAYDQDAWYDEPDEWDDDDPDADDSEEWDDEPDDSHIDAAMESALMGEW